MNDDLSLAIAQARAGLANTHEVEQMTASADYNEGYIVWLWQAIDELATEVERRREVSS